MECRLPTSPARSVELGHYKVSTCPMPNSVRKEVCLLWVELDFSFSLVPDGQRICTCGKVPCAPAVWLRARHNGQKRTAILELWLYNFQVEG